MPRNVVLIEPFGMQMTIVLTGDELNAALTRCGHPPDTMVKHAEGAVYTLDTPGGGHELVMFLPPVRDEWVLWHEALHAAVATLHLAWAPVCAENDEVLAYLQGHVVRLVDKAVYTPRRPKRKREVE